MSIDQLLSEVERQEKYLAALPENFSFPLFNTKRAVESQRQNGYRNTAAAAREIVDNAFEAEASEVHIITEEKQNGSRKIVSSMAFIDNGSGMLPKMARFPYGFAAGGRNSKSFPDEAKKRFDIRQPRLGVSFVRAGREIETFDAFPRSSRDRGNGLGDWPLLQSYAYHWAVEVRFNPDLDEVFGITNDKQ
jgi:Histidine kinase-, DNA gyrase B-, and HSP90-like ATPase